MLVGLMRFPGESGYLNLSSMHARTVDVFLDRRFIVDTTRATVCDCRVATLLALTETALQRACGAARRFELRSAVIDAPLQGEPLFAYFFFDFLAPDFLPPEDLDADDFFEPPLGSDFNLAFADFEAEDFLEPLPFFSTF